MTVKPPSGMQEELARPVIEVVEFPTGKVTHEMFAFGSELAIVPVTETSQKKPSNNWRRNNSSIRFDNGGHVRVQFTAILQRRLCPEQYDFDARWSRRRQCSCMQDQLGGLRLTIESLDDMPDSDDVSEHSIWSDDQDRRAYQSRAYEQHGRSKKTKGRRR